MRVIVDKGKYQSITEEQQNLATYVTAYGGQLHLSNPIFPRSFPKVILIDRKRVLVVSELLQVAERCESSSFEPLTPS